MQSCIEVNCDFAYKVCQERTALKVHPMDGMGANQPRRREKEDRYDIQPVQLCTCSLSMSSSLRLSVDLYRSWRSTTTDLGTVYGSAGDIGLQDFCIGMTFITIFCRHDLGSRRQ